ncbi:MAG: hypothetical protein LBK57_07485, partial [Clostridiales Family XIII bacterium]|nr:hypothetical protein [Clostridiales Family XIII bacterium]
MNKKKRVAGSVTAAVLTLCSVFSFAPAFAAETDGLETAILTAKTFIDVPADMDEFDYSHYTSNDTPPYVVYSLNWSNEDGSVHAEVANGRLVSFSRYGGGEPNPNTSVVVSRDEALNTAGDFLAAVDKTLAAKMELVQSVSDVNTPSYVFTFMMKENDIPVSFVTARVQVNKHTGEITIYYWDGLAEDLKLPEPGKENITAEQAREAFMAADGVRPEYRAWYDRESKKRFVKLVYALKNSNLAVDAAGEPVILNEIFGINGDGTAMRAEATADSGAEPQLTEAEISELNALEGLLSRDEARSVAIRLFPDIRGMDIRYESLRKESMDGLRYRWSLEFYVKGADGKGGAYASVNLDAKTGELLSWYYSDDTQNDGVPSVSYDKALETAQTFVEENAARDRTLRLSEDDAQIELYRRPGTPESPIYSYSFRFDRYEHDILFRDNGVNINIDSKTGKITRYNCNWFENIDIPEPVIERGEGLNPEHAFDMYDSRNVFGLKYVKIYQSGGARDARVALVWHWTTAESVDYLIDAVSFELLGSYNGMRYRSASDVSYDDMAGHWAESVVNELLESGYYYTDGDKFMPGERITQEGFLHYLYAPERSYYYNR